MENSIFIKFKNNFDIKLLINKIKEVGVIEELDLLFNQPDEELFVMKNLKDLKYLNQSKIIKLQKLKKEKKENLKINELNDFSFYNDINEFINNKFNFEIDFKNYYNKLEKEYLKSNSKHNFIKESLNLLKNFNLFNFTNNQIFEVIKQIDSSLYTVINSMNKYLTNHFFNFLEKIFELENYIDNLNSKIKINGEKIVNHSNDLIEKVEFLSEENFILKEEIKELKNKNFCKKNIINELETELKNNLNDFINLGNVENKIDWKTNQKKIKEIKFDIFKDIDKNFFIKKLNKNDTIKILKTILEERFVNKIDKNISLNQFFDKFLIRKFGNTKTKENWKKMIKNSLITNQLNDNFIFCFKNILENNINEKYIFSIFSIMDDLDKILIRKNDLITIKEHINIIRELKIEMDFDKNKNKKDYRFDLVHSIINKRVIYFNNFNKKFKIFDENNLGILKKKDFKKFILFLNLKEKYNFEIKEFISYNDLIELLLKNKFNFNII